eukprot:1517616-Amphidinium_carterae.1
MDQLLGVTPTVPQTVPVQPNTPVPQRLEFASPVVSDVEMRAQQPMGVGSQNAQVYDVASPRVVPQSRLKDRTRLPKLTLNMGM